jgi:hypothetical protein
MFKKEFGQVYGKDIVKRILRKFIFYFMEFILFSMNFIS